jgi:hypothetical protein
MMVDARRLMKKRRLILAGFSLALFLAAWLMLGIYRDREFGDHHLFVKHKPTLKIRFYAPLGESDRTLNELNPKESHEEVMYREYVEEHGGHNRSVGLGW